MKPSRLSFFALAVALVGASGCTKEEKPRGDLPPPVPSSAGSSAASNVSACASGGGEVKDPVSSAFFPKTEAGYCVDPQGETRTYGDRGKYSMDEVCTTAFDGECEVYKRFGLKRVVSFRYVDGGGRGATVDVVLSQFADVAGAFGMYTMRLVAGDPTDPSTPRVLDVGSKPGASAGGLGALGTGRAYVWRGTMVAELQYNNDRETPSQLKASSDTALTAIGRGIAQKLPEESGKPPSAQLLPDELRVANGVQFFPKEPFGWKNVGPTAVGYYKDGDRRWRTIAIAPLDEAQAKDVMKTLKQRPGSIPVTGAGDEAVHVVNPGEGGGPKIESLVARKGAVVLGIMDEEYAIKAAAPEKQQAARLTKEEAVTKAKALLEKARAPEPSASASASSGSSAKVAPSAAPSSSTKH